MKICKIIIEPIFMYGIEKWVPTQKDMSRIQAAEMRFLRKVKGCCRTERIRTEDIRAEEMIKEYRKRWKNVEDNKLTYRSSGHRPRAQLCALS